MFEERKIEEWLQELPDGYMELALENRKNLGSAYVTATSMFRAIDYAFNWVSTPEGKSFWRKVHNVFSVGDSLPPLPIPVKIAPEKDSAEIA